MRRGGRAVAAAAALVMVGACGGHSNAPPAAAARAAASTPVTPTSAAPTTTAAPRPLVWRSRASAPTAVQEVASVALDGKVWVIGGLTSAGASTKVETYDPAADRWADGPDLPVGLHHAAAAVYHGEIVVAGGFEDASSLYAKPTDRVLALRAGRWVDLPHLARPRGAAAAAVVGDNLVVAGGRDASLLIAPTEVFDGTAWHDRAPIPTLRDHLAAVADSRFVYTVGGRYLDPSRTSGAFERYDPARDTWETLPALPTARGGLGATMLGTRLVTAGGEDASRTYPQVEAFDIAAGAWSSLPNLPTARHGLALGTVGSGVAALVGGTAAGVAPSAVAEALAPG